MHDIKVISFDLDHTLFDFNKTLSEALSSVSGFLSKAVDHHIPPELLKETRDRLSTTPEGRSMRMLDLRRWSFVEALADHSHDDKLIDDAMVIFEAVRFGNIYLYPDADLVVRRLSKNYRLTAVTNGNSDPERTTLADVFEHVVFSEDHPFQKPDIRIFSHMMQLASVNRPEDVCHVGDSLDDDVAGGNAAGFMTVWFNPGRVNNETSTQPSFEIQSLQELIQIFSC